MPIHTSKMRRNLYSLQGKCLALPPTLQSPKTTMTNTINIPKDKITEFCRRKHIRKLALFGSVLRDDFRPDSDIDVLVEFEPEARVGFFELYDMEQELSNIIGGRKVD